MAIRRLGSLRGSERIRAPRENALRKRIKATANVLRDDFADFIESSRVFDDLARLAEQSTKARLPASVRAVVERALARSRDDFSKFRVDLSSDLFEESIKSYEAGATLPIKQMGLSGKFNLRNPGVLDTLSERANMLAGDVSDTLFDAIVETIGQEFFIEGLGPEEVARALRDEFSFMSVNRSRTIARTETLVVTEQAQFEQYAALGVERKRWIAAIHDDRTREAHREAHGQEVELFDPFIVGGEELLHPGDPNGSPENIINCRCADGPVVETTSLGEPWLGA